ncbi:unnamed protein product [Amoebophrya sp. A25]|nr:unnamed protein product [Amoebophrya sp. A25]|eukprot:GSA25T00008592001.1
MIKMVKAKTSAVEKAMTPLQLGSSPDGSRSLQACLKHGTAAQRADVLDIMNLSIPDLLVGTAAGGALVEKILRYCPKLGDDLADAEASTEGAAVDEKKLKKPQALSKSEKERQNAIVEKILKPLLQLSENKLTKLFFHKFGCRCFSQLLNCEFLKAGLRNQLLNKVQVPRQVSLLCPGYDSAQKISVFLSSKKLTESGKKEEVVGKHLLPHLSDLIDRCIDKELFDQPIVHGFLALYTQLLMDFEGEATSAEEKKTEDGGAAADSSTSKTSGLTMKHFVEQRMMIEAAPHLMQTKDGAAALIRILGYCSAKQKKTLVKEFKGRFKDMAQNNVCYLVVCRLLQTVDDTVLSQKQVLAEIVATAGSTAEDSLESLLQSSLYVRKVLLSCLEEPTSRHFSPFELDTCFRLKAPASVKDAARRREELRKYLAPILEKSFFSSANTASLFGAPTSDVAAVMKVQLLPSFVVHFYLHESSTEMLKTTIARQLFADAETAEKLLSNTGAGHTAMLVLAKNNEHFAQKLWEFVVADEERLERLVTSRAPYLIAEAYKTTKSADMKKRCVLLKPIVEKAEKAGKMVKAAKMLLQVLDEH